MRELKLDILREGLPGITPGQGIYFMEAAIVCLRKRGFESGVVLNVYGDFKERFFLTWTSSIGDAQVKSWKNEHQAAAFGAVAISILLAMELLGYNFFEESTIGTGIDYWMGKDYLREEGDFFIRQEARIEISGINKESPGNTVSMRIRRKKKQITASDTSGLPGWIAIVEFGTPKSKIIKK